MRILKRNKRINETENNKKRDRNETKKGNRTNK